MKKREMKQIVEALKSVKAEPEANVKDVIENEVREVIAKVVDEASKKYYSKIEVNFTIDIE